MHRTKKHLVTVKSRKKELIPANSSIYIPAVPTFRIHVDGVGSGWGRNPTLAISRAGSRVAELYDSLSHGFQSALHDHLAFRGNI